MPDTPLTKCIQPSPAVGPPESQALQALDPRASSLSALEGAMASWQCYPLAFLGGTRFGALTAEQQAEEESDGQVRRAHGQFPMRAVAWQP